MLYLIILFKFGLFLYFCRNVFIGNQLQNNTFTVLAILSEKFMYSNYNVNLYHNFFLFYFIYFDYYYYYYYYYCK